MAGSLDYERSQARSVAWIGSQDELPAVRETRADGHVADGVDRHGVRREVRYGRSEQVAYGGANKGIVVDRNRCRETSTFVPLSHAGLPGPPDQLHAFTCLARGQLLIRARAAWNRRGFAASIAVRSYATRKPVAFGFLNHTGSGGLYTSRGCVPHS